MFYQISGFMKGLPYPGQGKFAFAQKQGSTEKTILCFRASVAKLPIHSDFSATHSFLIVWSQYLG